MSSISESLNITRATTTLTSALQSIGCTVCDDATINDLASIIKDQCCIGPKAVVNAKLVSGPGVKISPIEKSGYRISSTSGGTLIDDISDDLIKGMTMQKVLSYIVNHEIPAAVKKAIQTPAVVGTDLFKCSYDGIDYYCNRSFGTKGHGKKTGLRPDKWYIRIYLTSQKEPLYIDMGPMVADVIKDARVLCVRDINESIASAVMNLGSSDDTQSTTKKAPTKPKTITKKTNRAAAKPSTVSPVIPSIDPGKITMPCELTLSCNTDDVTIYYKIDGDDWTEYTGAITLTETCTISTYAQLDDNYSAIRVFKYTYDDAAEVGVEITIPDSGWTTCYYQSANIQCPDDITAYTAIVSDDTQDGEIEVELYEISGGLIPAGTPAILRGTAGSYIFDIVSGELDVLSCDLSGAEDSEELESDGSTYYYELSTDGDTVTFVYTNEDGLYYVAPAHTAYLVLASSSTSSSDDTGSSSSTSTSASTTSVVNCVICSSSATTTDDEDESSDDDDSIISEIIG